MFESRKIRIYPLTPLFIGDGTDYSRLEFWFNDNGELVEFSESDLIARLNEQEKAKLGEMSLPELAQLIADKKPAGKPIQVAASIFDKYKKEKNSGNFENRFQIKKFVKEPLTGEPYIPGSSLKGALRTGYLHSQSEDLLRELDAMYEKARANGGRAYKKDNISTAERKVLGAFAQDIFSTLKVSDCVACESVLYILNTDRVTKKMRANQYKHLAVTMFEGVLPGSYFEGQLSVCPKSNIQNFQNITEVLKAVDKYSVSLLTDEQNAIKKPTLDDIQAVQKSFGSRPTYLVRLGGLIGAESHTIAGCRDIKIQESKGKTSYREHTARTIYATADEKVNMHSDKFTSCGWCLIEVIDGPSEQMPKELQEYAERLKKKLGYRFN